MAPLALALGWVGCVKQELPGPFWGEGWAGLGWVEGLRAQLTHESTHVANEAEEATLRGICAALAEGRRARAE